MGSGAECGFIFVATAVAIKGADPSHRWDNPRFVGINDSYRLREGRRRRPLQKAPSGAFRQRLHDQCNGGQFLLTPRGQVRMVSGQKGETLPPDAAVGHNDPVTGLSADGTFHLLSVRGPLTNQFPRT